MTDDRVNIKVPPDVHAELKAAKDMDWPDQLRHWKRVAEATDDLRESVRAIEERTGRIERAVEELGR